MLVLSQHASTCQIVVPVVPSRRGMSKKHSTKKQTLMLIGDGATSWFWWEPDSEYLQQYGGGVYPYCRIVAFS